MAQTQKKFEYYAEDCDCIACLHYRRKSKSRRQGCVYDVCPYDDIRQEAIKHGRIKRGRKGTA